MNYLPKSKARGSRSRKAALLIAVFAACAIAFSFFGGALVSAVSPLWKAENAVASALRGGFGILRSKRALSEENALLKERIASLELQAAALAAEAGRAGALMELMGRSVRNEGLVAAVLTRPPQSPYDIIAIDAGSEDGVAAGALVSLPEGPVLGTVSEVFGTKSKVSLFSGFGEETNALLERHGVPVLLEGRGAGNFRIVVPRETEVEVGDRVLSPELGGGLVAIVGGIRVSPTDSFKEVLAKSPANIFSVSLVYVSR